MLTTTQNKKKNMLFDKSTERFVLFPLKSKDIFDMYEKARDVFWVPNEVPIEPAETEFFKNKLKPEEQQVILKVLAFFAASDGIVIENLVQNFCQEVQLCEARLFYTFQAAMEAIHSEMYSLLIDSYAKNSEEKNKLFKAIENEPTIKSKADFAMKWMDPKRSFTERCVAFACVEGIQFSSSFCVIYWFKKRGILPGLTLSNEFISRDEALHAQFACLLFSKFPPYSESLAKEELTQPPKSTVLSIVRDAVAIECDFVRDCIQTDLIGLSAKEMCQYVEFTADRLLRQLGNENYYKSSNPFDWMTMISLDSRQNFFESNSSQYQKVDGTSTTNFIDDDF